MASPQPFTIVGGGRIGEALVAMGPGGDAVVKRGQKARAAAALGRAPPSALPPLVKRSARAAHNTPSAI